MPIGMSFQTARTWTLVGLAMLTLSACASSANAPPPANLPPASAAGILFQPVPHPPARKGDDARAKLAETSAALTTANRRIDGGRRWYEAIRSGAQGE